MVYGELVSPEMDESVMHYFIYMRLMTHLVCLYPFEALFYLSKIRVSFC